MEENKLTSYKSEAEAIKLAILQGQYEAAKGVNRIQLSVYFGIGKYISLNTRKGKWGTGALEAISQILRKELPGLRGFSVNSLKNMRKFYENWQILDSNSTFTNVGIESSKSTFANVELQDTEIQPNKNSTSTIVDLKNYKIDIYQSIKIPGTKDFPLEDFFRLFHEALMIEPTETESKETLDDFIAVMKRIAEEAKADPQLLKTAPHDTPVRRMDDVKAVKEPKFTFKAL